MEREGAWPPLAPVLWPRTFTVAVAVKARVFYGTGYLTVAPGALAVYAPAPWRAPSLPIVTHGWATIRVITTRLAPLGRDTIVVVEDDHRAVMAWTTRLERGSLLSALEASGVQVMRETRWLLPWWTVGDLVR